MKTRDPQYNGESVTNLEKIFNAASRQRRAAAVCILLRDDCRQCPVHGKDCVFDENKEPLADWALEDSQEKGTI